MEAQIGSSPNQNARTVVNRRCNGRERREGVVYGKRGMHTVW